MSNVLNGAIIALGIAGATIAMGNPVNAQGAGVSFDMGSVAFGYRDGYWDRAHHWHHWRSWRDAQNYRRMNGTHYGDWSHGRDRDQGWHDATVPAGVLRVDADFKPADVAFGYQDGYWDHAHQWHAWRDEAQKQGFKSMAGNPFNDYRHDRDPDRGWHGATINVGDVAFGYQDGYWDRSHQWHAWLNDADMRAYKSASGSQFNEYRHDRDNDKSWESLALNVGDVAFGYQDGYWDRAHQWHPWRNEQEMRDYRGAPGNQFYDYRHDRDSDQGWRGLTLAVGDVAFGYQDGYWDHAHQWHQWRNDQEMRDYRSAPGNHYNDFRHDRDGGDGWHS